MVPTVGPAAADHMLFLLVQVILHLQLLRKVMLAEMVLPGAVAAAVELHCTDLPLLVRIPVEKVATAVLAHIQQSLALMLPMLVGVVAVGIVVPVAPVLAA